MKKQNIKDIYKKDVIKKLQEKYNYKSVMAVPKIEKIIINRGLGEATVNQKVIELTVNQFVAITGQIPVLCRSKKAISNFKIRKDQIIGCKVTLRSNKMYDFLTKFINIALPKIRDFRGISKNSFDGRGNYTLGITESGIFPEFTADVDKDRGFDITFVTTAKTDKEAYDLLDFIGMPFRK